MKKVFSMSVVFITALVFALTVKSLEFNQRGEPFKAEIVMNLNTADTKTPKRTLIEELNNISKNSGGEIYKIVVDKENANNNQNIIWFGDKKPVSNNIIINQDEIRWLSKGVNGRLIHSTKMEEMTLSGTYHVSNNHDLLESLKEWAEKNQIKATFFEKQNTIKKIYGNFMSNPIGNSFLIANVFLLVVLLSYFLMKSKERSIKLLAGVKRIDIIRDDVKFVLQNSLIGSIIGSIIMTFYYAFTRGVEQINLIIKPTMLNVIFELMFIIGISALISVIVEPKASHIANREIPLKRFKTLGTTLKILTVLFALIVIPMTVTSAVITSKMANEHFFWDKMSKSFRLTFSNLDELFTDENIIQVQEFLRNMQNENSLSVSMAIDQSIEISSELQKSGFDHLIITDKSWIDNMGVGIGKKEENGVLREIKLDDIDFELKDFVERQMPLLINEEKLNTQNLKYYTFEGDKFLALAPNPGKMDATLQAENPLVILIENPADELNIKGFVIPALSTGNIVFSNRSILDKHLQNSPLKPLVISVDGIADLALQTAQKFKTQVVDYIVASLTLLVTVIFTGIFGAQLWANENKKKIYVMLTNGVSYMDIAKPDLRKDFLYTGLAIFLGSVICYQIRRVDIRTTSLVGLSTLILYTIFVRLAYRLHSKVVFEKSVHRE
ncbi:hypothetical protein EDD65_1065 [Keratinibaculum paraultunense]|uniref:DUF6619 domain-containing protein n=1 Tax=Keratinibaculum paraultunense TaxID=1278232 RepID=A0A4R3KVC0_9FIRM|nr:DUF6619 domain-containing protein [Keratinibaculum paraultunense]QQY79210.1 hypothetical protein JL105_08425 [Keratinibaculum paraultunense]TCS89339.1 hypothetical protein EDD65_1065 [Keratinibaculum paraultunense]